MGELPSDRSPAGQQPAAGSRPQRFTVLQAVRSDWRAYVIYVGFLLVFLVFALLLHDKGFLSGTNLLTIFRQAATISVMAVAMTFVIAAAEIDLSVGSVAGLSSVVTAMTLARWGLAMGILAGLGVGFL